MHDIWNPWHGCKKISEGCLNCYMYFLDSVRGVDIDSQKVQKTNKFYYPLEKKRDGSFVVQSGEFIRVCMTSDFFIEDADSWRPEVFSIIKERSDVIFFILTKRVERVEANLPSDWGDGYDNVIFAVTAENQKRADSRIPILLSLPFKHKGVMCAPLIGPITLSKYLERGQIKQVVAGGENYGGVRPCHYEWALALKNECEKYNTQFAFIETGSNYFKNGVNTVNKSKVEQARNAYFENLWVKGRDIKFNLHDNLGFDLTEEEFYKPKYREGCLTCASRLICNGCSNCGKCQKRFVTNEELEAHDLLFLSKSN